MKPSRVLILFLFFPLSACSVYESNGRKTLENQAYQLAGVSIQQNWQDCHFNRPADKSKRWLLMDRTVRAHLFVREANTYELKVIGVETGPNVACYFKFSSAQELYEKANAAVELSLLHLRLGQFAFHPASHLK